MKAQVREVKSNLSKYGGLANRGQRIVVTKNGKPWFDLVPHQKSKRNIAPLKGAKALISEEEATAAVEEADLEGWI